MPNCEDGAQVTSYRHLLSGYNKLILKYCSTSIRYEAALDEAVTHFKSLLSSSNSRSWKPLQPTTSLSYGDSLSLANNKGKAKELLNGLGIVDVPTVQVHRKSGKGADIVRAVTEIAVGDGVDLDSFKAVLRTPEIRSACKSLPSSSSSALVCGRNTAAISSGFGSWACCDGGILLGVDECSVN